MAKTVSITEAKAHLSELIAEIENGVEEIVICRRGTPVAKLTKPPKNQQKKVKSSKRLTYDELMKLFEGADTIEERDRRLKKAGIDNPILAFAGWWKDDPTWDDYMRAIRKFRKGK
jgi:prevent-host-death family protein